jgi:hypothetical protein
MVCPYIAAAEASDEGGAVAARGIEQGQKMVETNEVTYDDLDKNDQIDERRPRQEDRRVVRK